MKKFLIILFFCLFNGIVLHAQDENNNDDKIRDKMTEFIQRRLNLSKNEAEKFSPVFLRYFNEWRTTLRQFGNGPKLDLRQRIVELQVRYRSEFKEIIGEKRSNEVYDRQQEFIDRVRNAIREQRIENKVNRRDRAIIQ